MNETSENVAGTVAEQPTEAIAKIGDNTSTELSALAKAQLRLDIEARTRKAGRKTNLPIDHEFFNALEWSEQEMRDHMCSLGLAEFLAEFMEMRKEADARFPQPAETNEDRVPRFVDRHKAPGWLGMKGVYMASAVWQEAKKELTATEFESYATAVGLPAGSQQRALIEKIAKCHAKARSTTGSEHPFWAEFALALLLEERFDLLFEKAHSMGLLTASDLVHLFSENTLESLMNPRAERAAERPPSPT